MVKKIETILSLNDKCTPILEKVALNLGATEKEALKVSRKIKNFADAALCVDMAADMGLSNVEFANIPTSLAQPSSDLEGFKNISQDITKTAHTAGISKKFKNAQGDFELAEGDYVNRSRKFYELKKELSIQIDEEFLPKLNGALSYNTYQSLVNDNTEYLTPVSDWNKIVANVRKAEELPSAINQNKGVGHKLVSQAESILKQTGVKGISKSDIALVGEYEPKFVNVPKGKSFLNAYDAKAKPLGLLGSSHRFKYPDAYGSSPSNDLSRERGSASTNGLHHSENSPGNSSNNVYLTIQGNVLGNKQFIDDLCHALGRKLATQMA